MTDDLKALRAAADAATPGPWAFASDWDRAAVYSMVQMIPRFKSDPIYKRVVCSGNQNNSGEFHERMDWSGADHADARFIAAFNPAVAKRLLDRLEAAERDAARYRVVRLLPVIAEGTATPEQLDARADLHLFIESGRAAHQQEGV